MAPKPEALTPEQVGADMIGMPLAEFKQLPPQAQRTFVNYATNLLSVYDLQPAGAIGRGLDKAAKLKLDPEKSTTPHCIDEYNSGLTNAINAVLSTLKEPR